MRRTPGASGRGGGRGGGRGNWRQFQQQPPHEHHELYRQPYPPAPPGGAPLQPPHHQQGYHNPQSSRSYAHPHAAPLPPPMASGAPQPPLPTSVNPMGVSVRPGVQEEVVAFVQTLRTSRSHPSAPPNALSVSNVTHAICVHFQVNELEELLGVPPMQLPILRQLHTLNQRLWTFVTCFVQGRRINTLYECFHAFLLQEGIREFHELRMGNSFLHTEAVQSLYHGPTAMLNVSTRDILNHLRQFENMIGHDAFRNSTHIDRSEFLQYLSQQYRQPNVETLGIAIDPAGFGVYIGLLRRLSNQEMKEMKNIEQEFQKGIAEKVFELTKEKFSAENRKQALDELLKTHLSTSASQEQDQHTGGQQWKNKRNANRSTTASLSLEMLKRVTDIDVYLDNVLRRKAANEQRNNQKQISSQEIAETDLKIRNQLTRFLMATQKSKHHSRIKVVTWVLCGIMAKIHSLLLHDDKLPDEKATGEGDDEENEETKSKKKAAKDDDGDSEDECDCCCVGKDTCKCSCTCDCHANSSDEEEKEEEEKIEAGKEEEKSQSFAAKSSSKPSKSSKPVSEANPADVAAMKQEVDQYLTTYCESNDIESLEQLLMCFISLEIHMRQAMQNTDRSALELVLDLWSDAADKDEIKTKAWCQAFDRILSVNSSGSAGGDDGSDREEITKFVQQCYLTTSSSSKVPSAELTQQVSARVRYEFGYEKLQKIGAETVGVLLDEARESVQEGAEAISPSIVKYSNALLPVSAFANYDYDTNTGAPSSFPGESLRLQKTEEAIAALLQCPFLVDVAASTRWQQTFAPFCGSLRFFIRTHEMILLDHASSSSSSLMFLFCQNGVVLRVNEASTPSALEMLISASQANSQGLPPAHQVAIHLTSMLVKNGGQQNFPAQLVQAHVKTLFTVARPTATAATQDYDRNAALKRYVLDILLAVPREFADFVFSLLADAGATVYARSKFAKSVWEVCSSDRERRKLAMIFKSMNPGSVTWTTNFEHSQDQVFEAMEIDDDADGPSSQLQIASSHASGSKENDSEIADRFTRAQEIPTRALTITDALETSSSMELVPVSSSTAAPESCRQCIDTIRKEQFGIGLEIQDEATSSVLAIQQQRLERALKRLSDELYSENTHFVLELLQNADDNSYDMGIRAKGEFVLTSSNEVIFHNNERGFSNANIQAICDVGASTKSAQDSTSSIGKKGIGFKSVFKISDSPQVHSNGFHIRFHSKNEAHGGGLGYILPFWIEEQTEWQRQQGTTFVLPLNEASAQRVDEISESLMAFEPSILLFLRRICELRIADQVHRQTLHFLKEESTRSRHQTVQLFSQISRKGFERVSVAQQWLVVKRTLQAPAAFASSSDQVRETEIAVALPFDMSSSTSGDRPPLQQVFAYLPLRSYGFRFIVQSDFEVPSSREAIVNGSEWNQWLVSQLPGLMRQVVTCFVDEVRLTKTNDDDSVVAQVAHLLSLLPFENEIQAPFRSVVLDMMREISQVSFLPAAPTEPSPNTSLELVKPVQLLDAWEAVQDEDVLSVLTNDAQLLFTTLNKKLLHFELSKSLQPQQKNQLKIEKLKASHILQLLAHSAMKNDIKWTVEMLRVLGKLWKKDRHANLLLQELRLIKCFPIQSQDPQKKMNWVSLMDTGDALFLPSTNTGEKSSSSTGHNVSAASESFYGDLYVLDTDFVAVLSQSPDTRAFLIAQVKVKMIEDHDLISHHILPKMEGLSGSLLASAVDDEVLQLKVLGAIKRYSKFLASHLLACSKCPVSAEIQVKMRIWTCTKNLVPATVPNVFVMLPSAISAMPELSKWLQDKLRQSDKSSSFELAGYEYFEGGDAEITANRGSFAWQKLFVDTLKLPVIFDVMDARVVIAAKQILKWLTAEPNAKAKGSLSRELAGYLNKHWPATTPDAVTKGNGAIVELLRKTKWLSGTDSKFHRPETLWMATATSKALFSESMVPYSTVSWTNESLAVDILRLKKTPMLEDALSVLSSLSLRKGSNELLDISAVSRIYMLLAEQDPANVPAIKNAFSEQPLVFTPADDERSSRFVAVKDVVWSATSCNGHLIPLEQVYTKSLRQFFTEVCGVERKPSINSLCDRLEQLKAHESSTEGDHEAKKHWKKELLPIFTFFAKQIKKSALSKDEIRRIRKTLKATPWLLVSDSASDSRKLTWCSAKDQPIVPRSDEEREVQKIVIALQKERGGDSVNRIKLVKLDRELLDELDPLITLSKIRYLTAHAIAEPSTWCDLISESVASLDLTDSEDATSKKSKKKIQKLVKTLLIIWSKAFAQNPEIWKKADKQFQWKLQQSLLLPTHRDQHFMKPTDVFINDQIELAKESLTAEDASGDTSVQPALPIASLFPWTYFTSVDSSENQSEAVQIRNFLLMFCGAKSLKMQLSHEVIVLGSAQSESARLRSKIQQSLAVAQRLLFHQHRVIYDSLPHLEIARLCQEVKCIVVEDAEGLQVVYRIGKSFSVRYTPTACFLDMKTPVLYVIRSESGNVELSGLYEVLMEVCRKCFGLQIAASVANLLYLASMQPNSEALEKWLVETQQLAPISSKEGGTLWFSPGDAECDDEATTPATIFGGMNSSRKRSHSMLEDGEVKDEDDHHDHQSEKRTRQNAEQWSGGRQVCTGGGGGVFLPLPPPEGSDPSSFRQAASAIYPPLPASNPGGFGTQHHQQHQQMYQPHQPGSFQPPLLPNNNANSTQHTLYSDQVLNVGNTMTKEEREGIGRWGEEYVFKQLVESHKDNADMHVDWVNEHEESGKPYDITVSSSGKVVEYVEVKATRTMEKAVFEISMNELDQAAIHGSSYCIYRVFNAGNDALCRVIRMKNPIALVRQKKMQLALVMQ